MIGRSTEGDQDPVFEAKPAYLMITDWEEAFMKQLDRLVPSPRATKRFVNTYRLLKAIIPADQLNAFEGTETTGGEHQEAMVMLAMQTGYPVQAFEVFRLLDRERNNAGSAATTWVEFVNELRPKRKGRSLPKTYKNAVDDEMSASEKDTWVRLCDGLLAPQVTGRSLDGFTKYAPAVARFGFVTGRALASD